MTSVLRRALTLTVVLLPALAAAQGGRPSDERRAGEWPTFGGDPGATKYSALADLDRRNVTGLREAWRWRTGEQPIAASTSTRAARPGLFQTTPVMIGDTLYLSTPYARVVALDAATGKQYWSYDPGAAQAGQPSNGTGLVHRGVATGWGGGAFDPESGTIYIQATNSPALYRIFRTPSPSDTVDASYTVDLPHSSLSLSLEAPKDTWGEHQAPVTDIPIVNPPYGTLTAIDLDTGAQRWQVVLGDSPEIRNYPMQRSANLPPLLGVAGAPGAIVTRGGLLFVSGGGSVLHAIDKSNSRTLWSADLGRRAYLVPMTYRTRAGRQYVVIATDAESDAELVAFALPDRAASGATHR